MSVNLSKQSLKRRLESFYSLVAPELLPPQVSEDDWLSRFEEIYKKFGGNPDGEASLQSKLSKKYGSALLLTVAAPPAPSAPLPPLASAADAALAQRQRAASQRAALEAEAASDASLLRAGSGDLSFTSPRFDAYSALCGAAAAGLAAADPREGEILLDNVEKCRSLLPVDDPYYLAQRAKKRPAEALPSAAFPPPPPKIRLPTPFELISSSLSSSGGPMSFLSAALAARSRVVVLVRYVNCLRGTMTGTLLAFDKHFNILLADAEETYSRRYIGDKDKVARAALGGGGDAGDLKEEGDGEGEEDNRATSNILSPAEIEKSRRRDGHGSGIKTRKCRQVLVKGDMVVSVTIAKSN